MQRVFPVSYTHLIDHNLSGLVSLKEDNILSPKDLEGKRYATWDTPLEKAIISEIIKADGGDPKKLTYVSNTATDAISALQTDIDVVWIFYAWYDISAEVNGVEDVYKRQNHRFLLHSQRKAPNQPKY